MYFTCPDFGSVSIYSGSEIEPVFARLKTRGILGQGISESVRSSISDMDSSGFEALKDYSTKFDNFVLDQGNIRVPLDEIEKNSELLTADEKVAIDSAYSKTFSFQRSVAEGINLTEVQNSDGMTSFVPRPLRRVGIYVPGGLTTLSSSLMMAAVSARAAGVKDLIVCTPPKNGGINPAIAYLAKKFGITEIYRLGGIAAIWFMANGVEGVAGKVEKICGPGNSYVAEAKSQLCQSGKIAIDMLAGPSEVLIIADDSAEPVYLAADMLAQAEHGLNSSAVLITDSKKLANSVQNQIKLQLNGMQRKAQIGLALKNCGAILLVDDLLSRGFELADSFAPEHLELFCVRKTTDELLRRGLSAGAVFINTGEAFADYGMTGGNHILPTNGAARFSSGLSARDFVVWQYVEMLTPYGQRRLSKSTSVFADLESLEAHSKAASKRGDNYGES